jgi:hypothetical protein
MTRENRVETSKGNTGDIVPDAAMNCTITSVSLSARSVVTS